MNTSTAATLHLEIRESIAHLTLARPEAANTMNLQFGRVSRGGFCHRGGVCARGAVDRAGKEFLFRR